MILHKPLPLIAYPDSFLIAESRIPHRIGIIGIKLRNARKSLETTGFRAFGVFMTAATLFVTSWAE